MAGTEKAFCVTIRWGSESTQEDMYEQQGNEPSEYCFATEAELNAFLLGVDEMDGWMGYTVVEDEPSGE